MGKTDRMDNRDGAHTVATWIRQPESCAAVVAVVGLNLLVASLFVPVGVGNLALTVAGAACLVTGTLTLLVHLGGRLLGLGRRAERVVARGRPEALLPGVRPPQMYVHPRSSAPAPAAAVSVPRPASAIDLTDDAPGVGSPTVPQHPAAPPRRAGSAVG